ncbi:hypothetical protein KC675_03320 [Candidatus Dojkabacteria bacterium]|jgi:hypothetical protein|uniref:Uncharacterized protein n=1 Tax=Candidatus Dojkabacteria bacterium TaxID=2099670 RepID=A0A955I7U0_9BACT|nr:hypothetical protein [Candidatus Dojkabacteria bacterium]
MSTELNEVSKHDFSFKLCKAGFYSVIGLVIPKVIGMTLDHFDPDWVNKFEQHSPGILNGWRFVNSYATAMATGVYLAGGIRSKLYSVIDNDHISDLATLAASTAIYASAELGFSVLLESRFDPKDILYAAGASAVTLLVNKLVTRNQ